MPKGVDERHWEGRATGCASEARMRGVLRRPAKMLLALEADFVGAASAGAMALKADATLTRQLAAARSGKSIIVGRKYRYL
jgi:hypothetical protein